MSDLKPELVADGGIPQEQPERFEWILERAKMLDVIRGESWITDELEYLWENPEDYEAGEAYEVPDGAEEEDYALFKLALNFGVEYEAHYPQDGDWKDE